MTPSPRPPQQWLPERPVDAARAAALIGAAFPPLRGLPVAPLGEGWDNTVFVVGDEWVFRFPRRAVALPGFTRELAVLPAVAPALLAEALAGLGRAVG
jgi:aminoglycoside phosphotransferase (APT) family kinase protein